MPADRHNTNKISLALQHFLCQNQESSEEYNQYERSAAFYCIFSYATWLENQLPYSYSFVFK